MGTVEREIKEVVKSFKQVVKTEKQIGMVVLFSGPSGTVKTKAAKVLAAELNKELYKVDLAAVDAKYIGETEKNLSKVFKKAQTKEAILLFNGADSLFGKRTKVQNSHDLYDNIDVNYLLQRLEEYTGLVILNTNYQEQLDDSLKRRFRFVVKFA